MVMAGFSAPGSLGKIPHPGRDAIPLPATTRRSCCPAAPALSPTLCIVPKSPGLHLRGRWTGAGGGGRKPLYRNAQKGGSYRIQPAPLSRTGHLTIMRSELKSGLWQGLDFKEPLGHFVSWARIMWVGFCNDVPSSWCHVLMQLRQLNVLGWLSLLLSGVLTKASAKLGISLRLLFWCL